MIERTAKPVESQGRCIFCGGTGLSKEHIWSDWLKSLIPRNDAHGEYWGSMHRDSGSGDIKWTTPRASAAPPGLRPSEKSTQCLQALQQWLDERRC